jgi:hypothetical protein
MDKDPKLLSLTALIHYLKNKVGVVDFANAQGVVMFLPIRGLL